MQVLLQFNGRKKNFTYRNPALSVPELKWANPGDVVECDSKDAAILLKGSDFVIVGDASSSDPLIPPKPTDLEIKEVAHIEIPDGDEAPKKKPGRPKVTHDPIG